MYHFSICSINIHPCAVITVTGGNHLIFRLVLALSVLVGLFGVTIVVLVVCLRMKRRKKLKGRNSDEGLNTAYRDSECECGILDEEDTVYEMIRKRQIIDKVKSGFREQVENVGCSQDEEQPDEEQPAVIYI